ncbi:MAG: hypothetical protein LBI64_03475, partial [Coriobacteriales bacterium]|nr:hypothetical protein [Coriobacteriales bacterium]
MAQKKDINLYRVMTTKGKKAPVLPILVTLLVIVALGAALYSGFLYFSTTAADLTAQRDELDRYVHSSRTGAAYQESQNYQQLANSMAELAGSVKNTLVALSSYPDVSYETYTKIMELAGWDIVITDLSYDRRSGILSFSVSSEGVSNLPRFVAALRATGLFADIQYRGYVKSTYSEIISQNTTDEGLTTTNYAIVAEYAYSIQCQILTPQAHLPEVEGAD